MAPSQLVPLQDLLFALDANYEFTDLVAPSSSGRTTLARERGIVCGHIAGGVGLPSAHVMGEDRSRADPQDMRALI